MTRDADHGVLLMAHFARQPGQLIAARELASALSLPHPTVTKILKILARARLLESHRGLRGGYRLTRPPAAISVDEVIAAVQGPIAITHCSDHGSGCVRESVCPTHGSWQEIDRVVRRALGCVSLEAMARGDKKAVRTVASAVHAASGTIRQNAQHAGDADIEETTPRSTSP